MTFALCTSNEATTVEAVPDRKERPDTKGRMKVEQGTSTIGLSPLRAMLVRDGKYGLPGANKNRHFFRVSGAMNGVRGKTDES
jgi:hypothetical protein